MVIPNTLSDRALFELFKEEHPEFRTARQLVTSFANEDQFVAKYALPANMAEAEARRIYQIAFRINEKTALVWANLKDAVASPFMRSTLFNNIPQAFIDHQESIPGYDKLFDQLDYVHCDHCRSVSSPAAYFVDLMRFVQQHITDNSDNQIPAGLSLEERRPDLPLIQLDCNNTHGLIRYIDLVNEILEPLVRNAQESDAYLVLSEAVFPMSLPYHRPLKEIRAYLNQMKTSLPEIYADFQQLPEAGSESAWQSAINREKLGLSPKEYTLVTTAVPDKRVLSRYGDGSRLNDLALVPLFLERTGLSREALDELLFQDLSAAEINAGLTRLFFINQANDGLGPLMILSDRVPPAYEVTDFTLKYLQTATFKEGNLEIPFPNALLSALKAGTTHNKVFTGKTAFLAAINIPGLNTRLGLGLSADVISKIESLCLKHAHQAAEQLLNLSFEKLDRIYRFLKLARKLDWSFADLDWALRSQGETSLPEKAIYLDGFNDYIDFGKVNGLDTTTISIEAWVKPMIAGKHPIVCKGTLQKHYCFWIDEEGLLCLVNTEDDKKDEQGQLTAYRGNHPVPLGTFSHVAMTLSGKDLHFYIDGRLDHSIRLAQSLPNNLGRDFNIGRNLNDAHFAGFIKELRIWDKVIDQKELIDNRYRRLLGNESNLIGYWPLTEDRWYGFADQTNKGNNGFMGGADSIVTPTWIPQDLIIDKLPEGNLKDASWKTDRKPLLFNNPGRALPFEDDQELYAQRTLEVWFRVDNKNIRSRKQIIYEEGGDPRAIAVDIDHQRILSWGEVFGLNIYVHDGNLYFGMYSTLVGQSEWSTRFLKTDKIESGRWHHAAFVINGKAFAEGTIALTAYLDGRIIGKSEGPADLFWITPRNRALGGVSDTTVLHDGEVKVGANRQLLKGAILDFRIWNRLRSQEELQNNWYRQIVGEETGLDTWWTYDSENGTQIRRVADVALLHQLEAPDNLQLFTTLPSDTGTVLPLGEMTIAFLAHLSDLKDRFKLNIVQTTALWYTLKHHGIADGSTLFDQVFNGKGVDDPWPYYRSEPLDWDPSSTDEPHRKIQTQLMGSLGVALNELLALVVFLNGELRPLKINDRLLNQLYRLARVAKLLKLPVPDFVRLLQMIDKDRIEVIEDLIELVDLANWMLSSGITVAELDYFMHDRYSSKFPLKYSQSDIKDMADELIRQSNEFLLKGDSFESSNLEAFDSISIFNILSEHGYIEANGTVGIPLDQAGILSVLAEKQQWIKLFEAFEKKMQLKEPALDMIPNLSDRFIAPNGIVKDLFLDEHGDLQPSEISDQNIKSAFPAAVQPDTTIIEEIRRFLEQRRSIQGAILEKMQRSGEELRKSVLAGLSALLEIELPLVEVGFQYFEQRMPLQMTIVRFFQAMHNIQGQADQLVAEIYLRYFSDFSKLGYLLSKFRLTPIEAIALVNRPELFSVKNILHPDIEDLTNLFTFRILVNAFKDKDGLLVDLLEQETVNIAQLAVLSTWEEKQIQFLIQFLQPNTVRHDRDRFNRLPGILRLKKCFDRAAKLWVDITYLLELAKVDHLDFEYYSRQSDALFNILKARFDGKAWNKIYEPIRDQLAVQKRDALTAYTMLKLGNDFEGRRSPDVLYEFLLIDVQMGSETDTSRIVQAIASVQLYVQRCLMNLENGVSPESVPKKQWEWMKNYRVWEANRKVFLYPENYIEPELRRDKTPLFEALEQELLQGDIDQNLVEKAYTNYLDGFVEVANLKTVGSYMHAELPKQDIVALNYGGNHHDFLEIGNLNTVKGMLPNQLTVEAWVQPERFTPWSGIVGAVQDNGNFERGWFVGTRDTNFCFALASERDAIAAELALKVAKAADADAQKVVEATNSLIQTTGEKDLVKDSTCVTDCKAADTAMQNASKAIEEIVNAATETELADDDAKVAAAITKINTATGLVSTAATKAATSDETAASGKKLATALHALIEKTPVTEAENLATELNSLTTGLRTAIQNLDLAVLLTLYNTSKNAVAAGKLAKDAAAAKDAKAADVAAALAAFPDLKAMAEAEAEKKDATAEQVHQVVIEYGKNAAKESFSQAEALAAAAATAYSDQAQAATSKAIELAEKAAAFLPVAQEAKNRTAKTVTEAAKAANEATTLTYLFSDDQFTPGTWYHIAASYDGFLMALYINGELKKFSFDEAGAIKYPDTGALSFVIGAYKDDNESHPFKGSIFELRIWNKARTGAQIKKMMHQRIGQDTNAADKDGLAAYWRMDKIIGTQIEQPSFMPRKPLVISAQAAITRSVQTAPEGFQLTSERIFPEKTLYLIGRTDNKPYNYYYREYKETRNGHSTTQVEWHPWKKIELNINADFVSPVYAFNKLFLFWVDFEESKRSEKLTIRNKEVTETWSIFKPIVKYSYHNFSKTWIAPQVLVDNIKEGNQPKKLVGDLSKEDLDPITISTFNLRSQDSINTLHWKRVYPQRLPALSPQVKVEEVLVSSNRNIQLKAVPGLDTDEFTFSFWVKLPADFPGKQIRLISYNGRNIQLDAKNEGTILMTVNDNKVLLRCNIKDNNWHHISANFHHADWLFARDEYLIKVLIDGNQTFSVDLEMDQFTATGRFQIAHQSNTTTHWITEFRVWDGDRTRSEIRADKNKRLTGKEKDLLLYVPLDGADSDLTQLDLPTEAAPLTWASLIPPLSRKGGEPPQQNERIILLYGSEARSLRNNLKEKSFRLSLEAFPANSRTLELHHAIQSKSVNLVSANGLNIHKYAGQQLVHEDLTSGKLPLIKNLRRGETALVDVNNQPGYFILDTSDEQFLVKVNNPDIQMISDRLNFRYGNSLDEDDRLGEGAVQEVVMFLEEDNKLVPGSGNLPNFVVERLNTFAVHELSQQLFAGIDQLLSIASQSLEEPNFNLFQYNPNQITPPNFDPIKKQIDRRIDFNGAYGIYYWEIFFHIPFLIANRLNSNQKFEEAQQWYHYLFNPTMQVSDKEVLASPQDRYWRFRNFRNLGLETLEQLLTDSTALRKYREDPFDPHIIARLRLNAYQKAIVMKYLDNLLDWGDMLFRQDTREAINEAVMLYVLAYNLLGPKPQAKTSTKLPQIGTFNTIRYENDSVISDFLAQFEEKAAAITINGTLPAVPHSNLSFRFCVIENQQFMAYWGRVEDRLYKIRHSLNFDGIFRSIALFEPPIDPAALVRAVAGGRSIGDVLSVSGTAVPHYRFTTMLQKAKDFTSFVISLGNTLLSTLEKKNSEALTLLMNTHEKNILETIYQVKKSQLEEAEATLESLQFSLKSVEKRHAVYKRWFDEGLTGKEKAHLNLLQEAQDFRLASGIAMAVGAGLGAIPDATAGGSGVGGSPVATLTIGGKLAASIARLVGEGLAIKSELSRSIGEMTAINAGYDRRKEDWELQRDTAAHDIDQVKGQISAATVRLKIGEQEITSHEKQMEQNEEIREFYERKFTGLQLYNWMIGRCSGLYFQAYKMAFDLALAAEKAFQHELTINDTYVNFGHWDSLKKGLLAGESLHLDLNRLEKAYLEKNFRRLEIERTISLLRLDPFALYELINTGTCEFELSERFFASDYPGHYCRQIKTIAITIPAIVGPYQTIKATLSQIGNKTLMEPDINSVEYLLGVEGAAEPDVSILRADWQSNQRIAISKAVNDSGLFQLNFNDDRFLPFEGTGAVSFWRLEMPKANNQFDFNAISDVIIHLNYTAKADTGLFKQAVQDAIKNYRGFRVFSMEHEFSSAWHAFKELPADDRELAFYLPRNTFLPNLATEGLSIRQISMLYEMEAGRSRTDSLFMNLFTNGNSEGAALQYELARPQLVHHHLGETSESIPFDFSKKWILKSTSGQSLEGIKNVIILLVYEGVIDY